jgi:hypothetical protein
VGVRPGHGRSGSDAGRARPGVGRASGLTGHLAPRRALGQRGTYGRAGVQRAEAVALLFAVHDINATLLRIESLLAEDVGEAEEDD